MVRSAHSHNGILRGTGSRRRGKKPQRDMERATMGKLAQNFAGLGIPYLGRRTIVLLNEDKTPARAKTRSGAMTRRFVCEKRVNQAPVVRIQNVGCAPGAAGCNTGAVGRKRHRAGIQFKTSRQVQQRRAAIAIQIQNDRAILCRHKQRDALPGRARDRVQSQRLCKRKRRLWYPKAINRPHEC